jgi:tRNA dimethylallyltransferase
LIARYGPLTGTAGQAVGYKELQTYLSGNTTYDDTVDQIKAHTRQFARRQEIWFRSLRELVRFELTPATDADKMVNELTDFFTSNQVSD